MVRNCAFTYVCVCSMRGSVWHSCMSVRVCCLNEKQQLTPHIHRKHMKRTQWNEQKKKNEQRADQLQNNYKCTKTGGFVFLVSKNKQTSVKLNQKERVLVFRVFFFSQMVALALLLQMMRLQGFASCSGCLLFFVQSVLFFSKNQSSKN